MDTDSFSLSGLRSKVIEWLGGCERLEALKRNGRNNRVFEVENAGKKYFCKQYYRGEAEKVSARQDAEWRFAKLANRTAPKKSPEALFRDEVLAVSLFEYIDGNALRLPVSKEDVVDAFQFLERINREIQPAEAFPLASDSCISLEQHRKHVERRLLRFERVTNEKLLAFVGGRLRPVFEAACDRLQRIGDDEGRELAQGEWILSPSDFGFHNALRRPNGEIAYLDFEYAGWDDPVKCIGDFFAQPDLSVDWKWRRELCEKLPEFWKDRCDRYLELLRPLYVVKWACIILNPYLMEIRERRRLAGVGDEVSGCLAKAVAYVEDRLDA